MRLFQNINHAILEIRRDLTKSPHVLSHRVQHIIGDQYTAEATNYTYAIMQEGMPDSIHDVMAVGRTHFDFWQRHEDELTDWLRVEKFSRISPFDNMMDPPEAYHPTLKDMKEGGDWSYHYSERLGSAFNVIVNHLTNFPTSRRAFWPIFHPIDAVRGASPTRIPCTLGYYWTLRNDLNDETKIMLECTLLQRSCDFEKYWLSDVWLANELTKDIWYHLSHFQIEGRNVSLGNFNHIILSFHRFIPQDEEIF